MAENPAKKDYPPSPLEGLVPAEIANVMKIGLLGIAPGMILAASMGMGLTQDPSQQQRMSQGLQQTAPGLEGTPFAPPKPGGMR